MTPKDGVPLRCWDSDAFIGWLASEPDKATECGVVLDAAAAGKLRIVTSALTLVEVVKLRKHVPLPAGDSEKIKAFFKHEYITVVQVTRFIAEDARELVWAVIRRLPSGGLSRPSRPRRVTIQTGKAPSSGVPSQSRTR